MKTLTVAQIHEADRRCIDEIGIPGAVLMNNAGQAVFNEIVDAPVGVVCGKGNNGGDGFVVARLALAAGLETRVVLIADPETITGDASSFMRAYTRLGGKLSAVQEPGEITSAMRSLDECAVIVDALLGTGVHGEVHGSLCHAMDEWPSLPTIAVDVPSGMNADTGEICGCCVPAKTTVTFQFAKKGFENPEAQPYLGRLVIADIGIPEVCADDDAWHELKTR